MHKHLKNTLWHTSYPVISGLWAVSTSTRTAKQWLGRNVWLFSQLMCQKYDSKLLVHKVTLIFDSTGMPFACTEITSTAVLLHLTNKNDESFKLLCICRPLGSENLLLRGATLKNTEYIYGNITWNTVTIHYSPGFSIAFHYYLQ